MSHTIELPWGNERLSINLPNSWTLLGELKPRSVETKDPAESCAKALAEPIAAEPLQKRNLSGKRIVVVVDDHSRPTPVSEFIGPALRELSQGGARNEDIEFLIATGVHRASSPEEAQRKLGPDVADRFRWRCHDAYDATGLADVGVTSRGTRVFLNRLLLEADLVVCLGAVEPHLLLGFGGGLKMIIPGCAGAETIGANHMQGVEPDLFDYVGIHGENSPMRLDIEEGARLAGKDYFIVNAAMNEHGRPVRFFCGDPIKAQRAASSFVESLVRLETTEPADVVLTNSFPMDLDLRQSLKCLGNSAYACKPGGILMGCVRAEQGLGEMPLAKKTLPYPVMKTLLKIIGKNRILKLVEKAKQGEPVEEVFIGHFALQMLRRNHLAIFSDSERLPRDIGRKMGMARSFTKPDEMISWASSKAPRNATVWVFPFGGVSYAASASQP